MELLFNRIRLGTLPLRTHSVYLISETIVLPTIAIRANPLVLSTGAVQANHAVKVTSAVKQTAEEIIVATAGATTIMGVVQTLAMTIAATPSVSFTILNTLTPLAKMILRFLLLQVLSLQPKRYKSG